MKILEVVPDEFGFRQYAVDLVLAGRELGAEKNSHELLDPLFFQPLKTDGDVRSLIERVRKLAPDLVHVQHEFGFMGSKVPGKYRFPFFVQEFRRALPGVKLVATAHSVIAPDFRYPVEGRGWQAPFRMAANLFLMPFLRPLWIRKSWGGLDGVLVHSRFQLPAIQASGCPKYGWAAHYVPDRYEKEIEKKLAALAEIPREKAVIFVFGYFTPEKGQDVIIRAMAEVSSDCHLILAGGVRREEDRLYYRQCLDLIDELGLKRQVSVTGFVSWPELDDLCRRAKLAVIPFRETSGSGSLADLMSRKTPILSSDLSLNLEIGERVPGSMVYFKSEDPADCARQIDRLLGDEAELGRLREKAMLYREKFSPAKVMEEHLRFFESLGAHEKA